MMEILIPDRVDRIIKKLNSCGFEAFAVGGCVRDSLLGRSPEDWDITTSAQPEQVKGLFARTIDTGIQHGTVTIMIDNTGYEVTTYRIDGEYEDGRHPNSVEFTASLLEDLRRRDFTINAMAYSHETGLVDAFGGMEDLEKKVIRCVGDPMDRFGEDALRLLRAIRFSAQLGFAIEEKTQAAIAVMAPNMVHVSKERIQAELTKLLLSDHPQQITMVFETGISHALSHSFALIDYKSSIIDSQVPAVKHLRWACFLRLLPASTATAVLRELKMDNDTIYKVSTLVRLWNTLIPLEEAEIRKAMSGISPELYDDLLTLQKLLLLQDSHLAEVEARSIKIRQAGDCISLKTMAVTGNDLIHLGIKPGRRIGEILEQLFQMVLECPEKNKKEYLLSQIEK